MTVSFVRHGNVGVQCGVSSPHSLPRHDHRLLTVLTNMSRRDLNARATYKARRSRKIAQNVGRKSTRFQRPWIICLDRFPSRLWNHQGNARNSRITSFSGRLTGQKMALSMTGRDMTLYSRKFTSSCHFNNLLTRTFSRMTCVGMICS